MNEDNYLYINEKVTKNSGNALKSELLEINSQLEKKICKINGKLLGSGFFIKIPHPDKFHLLPVLATNNHVLGVENLSINNVINFSINNDKEKKSLKIDKSRKVFTDEELDVTIIEIKPEEDGIKDFFDLDDNFDSEQYNEIYKENEDIYILQYPDGKKTGTSFGKLKKIENKNISHNCSTVKGSSGSPILLARNYKVIGIHKQNLIYNSDINQGTFMKFVIEKFNEKYAHKLNHNNMIEMILDNNEKEDIYILNFSNYIKYMNKKISIKGVILSDSSEKLDSSKVKIFINNEEEIYKGENKLPKGLIKLKLVFETLITNCKTMFYKLDRLISIDLSSFVTREVKDMSYMFSDCVNLKPIKLNFETNNVTDMSSMFNNCSKLEYLDLSTFNTINVKNMSYMFNNCSDLKHLNLPLSFNTDNVNNMTFMFNNCSTLENLKLPLSFGTKNVKDMNSKFSQCKNISSLNLESFNTENVTNMESMFCDCQKLKELNLSKFNTKNVQNMEKMFFNCSELNSLDLSKFNTSNTLNMNNMFSGCAKIEYLDLSSFNTTNVKNMDNMFCTCSNLIGVDLSSFNIRNVENMSCMFKECVKLVSLNLSSFDMKNNINMEQMFKDCRSLEEIYINENKNKNLIKLQIKEDNINPDLKSN